MTAMKYLCLIYAEESALAGFDDAECVAYDAGIRSSGHCLASEALQPVQTATTVRVRNGAVTVTDGPFAETKEALAGFYLVEARDLDEVIAPPRFRQPGGIHRGAPVRNADRPPRSPR
jgi:hypothetical protein